MIDDNAAALADWIADLAGMADGPGRVIILGGRPDRRGDRHPFTVAVPAAGLRRFLLEALAFEGAGPVPGPVAALVARLRAAPGRQVFRGVCGGFFLGAAAADAVDEAAVAEALRRDLLAPAYPDRPGWECWVAAERTGR